MYLIQSNLSKAFLNNGLNNPMQDERLFINLIQSGVLQKSAALLVWWNSRSSNKYEMEWAKTHLGSYYKWHEIYKRHGDIKKSVHMIPEHIWGMARVQRVGVFTVQQFIWLHWWNIKVQRSLTGRQKHSLSDTSAALLNTLDYEMKL